MTPTTKNPRGILCPNCAEPMRVRITRQRADGSTQRTRQCETCGFRMKTYERLATHQENRPCTASSDTFTPSPATSTN